jgi:GxxExxY protein
MLTNPPGLNTLTHAIIGCGIRVHREIGPGVLENIYNECMQYELRQEGLRFDRERPVPLVYKARSCDRATTSTWSWRTASLSS